MHSDPELLALLALGEREGTDDERAHAQSCPQCAAELSELSRVVVVGRHVGADPALAVPSPDVWARIRAELVLEEATLEPPAPLMSSQGLTAHARLTPVGAPWSSASGTAELAIDALGRRLLQVALSAELPTSGVRQAWLVHRDDPTVRQSVGILDGPHGLWTIERSIDLAEYPILDISQQGTGETEHSGQTIVRGQLALAS